MKHISASGKARFILLPFALDSFMFKNDHLIIKRFQEKIIMGISKKSKIILAVFIIPIIIVVVLITMAVLITGAQFMLPDKQLDQYSFFRGSFSMSPDEIKALYADSTQNPIDTEQKPNKLVFTDTIAGYPVTVTYTFALGNLASVECVFHLKELTITECQEMAEKLIALLTPYFEPEQYDYHGFARARNNGQATWFFGGVFWTKNLWICMVGNNHPEDQDLAIIFLRQTFIMALITKAVTANMHDDIHESQAKYGDFDYDKWRSIPAITEN